VLAVRARRAARPRREGHPRDLRPPGRAARRSADLAVTAGVRVVLASANPDKAKEILDIVGPLGIEVAPRPTSVPDVVEDADTLHGNARLKAMAIASAAGAPALADDTGLEVDALDGAPGVYTARFAGEDATYADNVALLLSKLDGVAEAQRSARFRTVA